MAKVTMKKWEGSAKDNAADRGAVKRANSKMAKKKGK